MPVKPIPENTSTVIPYLVVPDAAGLIEFLTKVFDAKEVHRSTMPNGAVMHAHFRIGDSSVMLGQAPANHPAMNAMLYVYVSDVDATHRRAEAAGVTSIQSPRTEFYGDRVAALKDGAGNQWYIATHVEDVSNEEMAKRAAAAMAARKSEC